MKTIEFLLRSLDSSHQCVYADISTPLVKQSSQEEADAVVKMPAQLFFVFGRKLLNEPIEMIEIFFAVGLRNVWHKKTLH